MRIIMENEVERLFNLIDQHHIISFDVYDTALLRNVLNPIDLFEVVQRKLTERKIHVDDFQKIRIKAEETARTTSQKEDVSIQEIYLQFGLLASDFNTDVIKNVELETEIEFTIANPVIKKACDYALSKGKTLIFISDMYLPHSFIKELLNNLGYKNFTLYVSNEVGKSKGTGNLYRHIQDMHSLKKESWLHIGDNYYSDYKGAMNYGISAYHYLALRERVLTQKKYSLEYSIMKAIQINLSETGSGMSYWKRLGVLYASSIFWGFTNWLIHCVKDMNQDNLFFLSRDGYIPFLIYKKLSAYVDELPSAKYLYASRRVYQLPDILKMRKDEALELLTAFNPALSQKITVGEIFDNIGLDKIKFQYLLAKYHIENYRLQLDESSIRAVRSMLEEVYDEIIDIFRKENEVLEKYLMQSGVMDYKDINIVDVGWRGSTQKAIKNLSGKVVNGFYFGISNIVYPEIKNNVKGYAFSINDSRHYQRKIMENVMMFELLFSAPHGSLIKLENNDNDISPVFSKLDSSDEYFPLLVEGILEVTDLYMNFFSHIRDISKEECLADYFYFINEKNHEDLLEFSKIKTSVGIGDTQDKQQFVTSVSLKEYARNKRKIRIQSSRNLWKYAIYVYGSADDINKGSFFNFVGFVRLKLFFIDRVVKGVKNPKKAYKYMLKRIRAIKRK